MLLGALIHKVVRCSHEEFGHFGASQLIPILRKDFYFRQICRCAKLVTRSYDLWQRYKLPQRALVDEWNPIIPTDPEDLVPVN